MTITELLLRILIAFIALLTLTRLMGQKEISEMTFFNFVSGIAIGTIGGSLVTNSAISIRDGLIALIGWCLITIGLSYIDIKFKKVRPVIEGQPRIVIKQGKIMEDELRKVRLDVDSLNSLLREKDVFSMAEVDLAVFETDGKLSVMKKQAYQSVTKADMAIQQANPDIYPMSTMVISDGKWITANLEKLNLDQAWVEQQLRLYGISSISDVFYAEVQRNGSLHIDSRADKLI